MSAAEAESRRAPRLRTFKGGTVVFGVAPPLECLIRNMSQTGAALELQIPAAVPDEFTLIVKPEFVKRKCRVAWRSQKRIGVQFV
jgi:hypothetical protein